MQRHLSQATESNSLTRAPLVHRTEACGGRDILARVTGPWQAGWRMFVRRVAFTSAIRVVFVVTRCDFKYLA